MKIPLALSVQQSSGSTPQSFQAQESGPSPGQDIWITVPEAAALLKVRPSAVVKRIQKGTLEGKRSEDNPFTHEGTENFLVLLSSLPERLQYQYHVSRASNSDKFVSVDLVSPRSVFGDIWLEQFINIARLLRDVAQIHKIYRGTGKIKEQLIQLAQSHHISLSTLYRFSAQPQSREISLLYTDPAYLQYKLPKTMCLWSCDLAFALYLDNDNKYSQNEIFGELKKHSTTSCDACPYSPNSNLKSASENASKNGASELGTEKVVCTRCNGNNNTIIIPQNRKTVNRLLAHVPPSLCCYVKEGYRQWRAKYGLFVMRKKPLLINASASCDNHVCDCFIRIKLRRTRNDKIYEKEIAARPILTVWMDTASRYITGWAISIIPNADTIAEAFARACVYKVGDISSGIPCKVILDCGKDMKSKLLDDPCSRFTLDNWDDSFLNERFMGIGLFQALGCEVQRNLPYSPQAKGDMERFFRILEEKYISKMCGWCHNSVAERPEGFAKKLKQLLEEKKLLTLEEFVDYFQNVILPDYHGMTSKDIDDYYNTSDADMNTASDTTNNANAADDEKSNAVEARDEIDDGYTLSLESMSPAQRYKTLEKARNVVPSWQTMGILMRHYAPDVAEIKHYGIKFAGIYYQNDKLNDYAGYRASILYHSYQKPFAPSSIIVIVEGKAICEAFPAQRNKMSGESGAKLTDDRRIQNAPQIKMSKTLDRIGKSVHSILPEKIESHELSDKEQLQEYSFAPAIREIETMTATSDVMPHVDTAMISAIFSQESDNSSSATSSNIDVIAGNVETPDEQTTSAANRRKREKEFESARELLFGENEF